MALFAWLALGAAHAQAADVASGDQLHLAVAETSDDTGPRISSGSKEIRQIDQEPRLDEIVVTAQKRPEKLQDVPVSVQVISSATLYEQNHNSLSELSEVIPDLHVESGGYDNHLFMRGVGAGDNPMLDQAVVTFVDDIYHGRSKLSNEAFLDFDHIEVLKGPQSTFFGNNAIAGALNIVTKQPGDTFEAWSRALYGMFGQYAFEGAMGGPITDTLGARLAVTRNGTSEGWLDDLTTGTHIPKINNEAARLSFVFKPTDELKATLKIEASHHRSSGGYTDEPLQWYGCPPPPPIPTNFGGTCNDAIAKGVPMGLNTHTVEELPGQFNDLSTAETVLTLSYQKWGQTFTSVSGYNDFNSDVHESIFPEPVLTYGSFDIPEKYNQFSQEFRVASPTGGPFEYLAGVYFQTDRLVWDQNTNLTILNSLASIPAYAGITPYLPLGYFEGLAQNEKIYSVFGSLSWNVTDQLKLNAGVRGISVQKDVHSLITFGQDTQTYGGFAPLPTVPGSCGFASGCEGIWTTILGQTPGPSQTFSRDDKALMPSAGIQYKVAPQAMAYFTYSKGFLAGGFDAATLSTSSPIAFKPEYVNAYELGLKSKWFDDRVLLNLSVFRSDYKDLQVEASIYYPKLDIGNLYLANAASSLSEGAEFEGQWLVTQNFRLTANITYLDAHFVSYPDGQATQLQNFCRGDYVLPTCARFPDPVPTNRDQSGWRTPDSPLWSGRVSARYTMLLPGGFRFTTDLSPFFSSSYNLDRDNFFPLGTPAYVRLDGGLTLDTPDGHWAIDLIGKNLTDRIIILNPNSDIYDRANEQPRNVAIQVRYHF
jgi:outer membrane receptor protein involved in Fe transport